MIMKNIKINILEFSDNNNWHYEILIDDKRVISGWYKYALPYTYYNKYCILEHFPKGVTKHQIKKLNNKYSLVEFTNSNWARCFTHEVIDLVSQKIYKSYKNMNIISK